MTPKKQVFQQIIADFFEKPLDHVIPRDYKIPLDLPKIISLLGPRRAGKTYILFDLIKQLRASVPVQRLVYVNFEDDRLFPLRLEEMDDLIQGYYELYPNYKEEKVWFFFDEIQEVPNWEKFIRRLFDQENCRIYLTGSSSKLLSRELATVLRGRSIPYEIFPLNFKEFLQFNKVEINPITSKGQALLLHHLRIYLKQGGFPELVFLPPDIHNRIVNEYIDLLLYRDLTERFSVKHPQLVKYLLKYALTNLATAFSVQKVFNDIKSQGYKVGKNSVYEYLSYLEEAFIVFRVDIWSRSIRKQAVNPSKTYAIDPAFKYAMSIGEDYGRVLENAVFLELRRRGIHPAYFYQKQEVDFYWENGILTNACYDYRFEDTRKREINGLLEAMDYLNLQESQLISWDNQEILNFGNKQIVVRPLWEFLLAKSM
jgi:predicted AAA+ superfamily ATPase